MIIFKLYWMFLTFHEASIIIIIIIISLLLLLLLFFIKCKNIINQKGAGDQQYKEKGTKSLDQIKSKTSLLNRRQREQTLF
jgi:competence protein ComGC